MALNAGARENLLVRRALAESLVHLEMALRVRHGEHIKKLIESLLVEILGEAETSATAFKSADRLLESLLISLTNGHYLADSLHLGTEMIFNGAELLERPAGELKNNIIARRSVLVEAAVAPVGNLVERVARGELSRNKRDREARRLRSESGGARSARINLDNDYATRLRIVGPLNVAAADDTDRLDDLKGVAFEFFFKLLGNRKERCRAEAVARMNADRVDILDKAYGDHLVLGVADDLDLELLPVKNRLFDKALSRKRRVETACADRAEFLDIVAKSAARAAHRVGGAHDYGVTDLILDEIDGLLDSMNDTGAGSLDPEALHRRLKHLAVFAALNRVEINADYLNSVLVENTLLRELHRKVKTRLTA